LIYGENFAINLPLQNKISECTSQIDKYGKNNIVNITAKKNAEGVIYMYIL